MDDPVLLSRIQFAVTAGFHFIFPPISIGLAWLLVLIEYLAWRRNDQVLERVGRFFGKILGLTFAVGVASGIVLEFQFGTNWADYSRFVGDVFGPLLASEGVFAFFLESVFLGLYLLGRNRIPRGLHWASILIVAIGATISAFFILVANSWQQTPTGHAIVGGRAEMQDFFQVVFNPSSLPRFFHTMAAAVATGSFFMGGISAFLLLKGRSTDVASRAVSIALFVGLIASLALLFPTGDWHARQVAHTQPEKFAAIEGQYVTEKGAPLYLFGIPRSDPPRIAMKVAIPKLMSLLAFGDLDAEVPGMDQFRPEDVPPLALPFLSFHGMVMLGMLFIGTALLGVFLAWRRRLDGSRRYLRLLLYVSPLPLVACELGWITAEVGRQPWIVYRMLRTADAISRTVSASEVLTSLVTFSLIYVVLLAVYLVGLRYVINRGPAEAVMVEVK